MVDIKEFAVVVCSLLVLTAYVVYDNKVAFQLPVMLPRLNVTRLFTDSQSSEDRAMDRIMAQFNMTAIWELQNVTRQYFSPRRHIIQLSDLDNFVKKCNTQSFTLLKSSGRKRKVCDVTHTPVKHYRTCAVIGNGGILLNSSCGAEIDAHEFVIRSNLPPTVPYDRDVGKKTNLTTINHRELRIVAGALGSKKKNAKKTSMLARLGQSPGMIFSYSLSLPGSASATKKLKTVDKAIKDNNIDAVTAFSHRSYIGNRGLYRALFHKGFRLPSTGLNTFALASTFCDRISMYGYYPLHTYHNRTVPYHYYDGVKDYTKAHKMPEEFKRFQELHRKGAIRLVLGKCEEM